MAKQLGAVRFVGKFANAVGYKARDGRGDGYDAVRAYTTEVANPQTLAQMSQRMKLTPIQNFYRGLQDLLDHSWQGVKYKNPSRLHFYSLALRALSSYGVPYVVKGERTFVPWAFPVSSGSIAVDTSVSVAANGSWIETVLSTPSFNGDATLGQVSSYLLANNIGLREGDQLTFVAIVDIEGSGLYQPVYARFILDKSNETTVADFADTTKVVLSVADGIFQFFVNIEDTEPSLAAGALIVSRLNNSVWQRSNSVMAVSQAIVDAYNSSAAFDAMLQSYRTSGSTESPWYLNNGGAENGSVEVDTTVQAATVTVNEQTFTVGYVRSGAKKYVPYREVTSGGSETLQGFQRESETTFRSNTALNFGGSAGEDEIKAAWLEQGYTLIPYGELNATTGQTYFFLT